MYLDPSSLSSALSLRDLTDATAGLHACQRVVERVVDALRDHWTCPILLERGSRVTPVADCYDALGYPVDGPAREARYTRYVDADHMLRSQTSAIVPGALRALPGTPADLLLACPGLVWRRDVVDRWHVGTPHQLDLWRITDHPMAEDDLMGMIATAMTAIVPDRSWRTRPADHPYTLHGREIEVADGDDWVEVGECGVACPGVLARAGLLGAHGLAMGLGVDRLLMLAKGVPDIRLLRDGDPRVAEQMLDLSPWRPVSAQPPARRDLSVAVTGRIDDELLGDRVREALGEQADLVEHVELLTLTPYEDLPDAARTRLGMMPGQSNALLRMTLRHPTRPIAKESANGLRDRVWAAIHEGTGDGR